MNSDRQSSSQSDKFEKITRKSNKQIYNFCCKKCKQAKNERKICICIVPRGQRNKQIEEKGCQNCGCKGCSIQNVYQHQEDPECKLKSKFSNCQSQVNRKDLFQQKKHSFYGKYNGINVQMHKMSIQDNKIDIEYDDFDCKKGCCQRCMKEFSKSGKSCLCRVAKDNRKTRLPKEGCHICSCKGCNSRDKSESSSLRSRSRSRGSSVDSIEQKIEQKDYNLNNIDNSVIGKVIIVEYGLYPAMLGMGIPQRTPNYILGKPN